MLRRTGRMDRSTPAPEVLRTTAGELPLAEYRLRAGGQEWSIVHAEAVLSNADEADFLRERKERVPYGLALWPAAIALAHEVAARAEEVRGWRVLELGAGTGLPGLVAASLGAAVVQSDRHAAALALCRRNAERNAIAGIEHRLGDWAAWDDAGRYDCILGADILYGAATHAHLRRIFETNLAPDGRLLLADPFRAASLQLLEAMEADGWTITMSKWSVGEAATPRAIGVFEAAPPEPAT